MTGLQVAKADSPNLPERFRQLSSWISGNFGAPWTAEPVGTQHTPSTIRWASADGVTISRAHMSPLRLVNPGGRQKYSEKYYVYTANQTTLLRSESRPLLHLQPGELVILGSETPCEYLMLRHYVTSSLVIESDLFHQYLPDPRGILGRKLSLPYGLDAVLQRAMDSAWELSSAGLFGSAGPTLAHSFLSMLALAPLPDEVAERSRSTALNFRCTQIRSFIDKNYSRPDLTVMSIAEHFQLSPRYIQQALSVDSITPGEYLRNCRLEAATRMLRDPAQAHRSITQIAFDSGFNSSGYFSTEFRRTHGVSPRDFRAGAGPA
jgi:AraC-like DNA-binding protein